MQISGAHDVLEALLSIAGDRPQVSLADWAEYIEEEADNCSHSSMPEMENDEFDDQYNDVEVSFGRRFLILGDVSETLFKLGSISKSIERVVLEEAKRDGCVYCNRGYGISVGGRRGLSAYRHT